MPQRIVHGPQAESPQPLLELRPDEWEVGEAEAPQEFSFRPWLHDMHAVARRPQQGLGDPGGQLGDQARGTAPDGHRECGGFPHRGADAPGRLRHRLVAVQLLRARHIEVELVARGLLDRRREPLERGLDVTALLGAGFPRNGDDHRLGAETDGAGHRHRGVDAVAAGLVRGRRNDSTALRGAADDEQRRPACTVRIDELGHGHVKCIGVREQNAPDSGTAGRPVR